MPPNIVFILSDQQRWDTLGYGGMSPSVTPILDRLAEGGTVFTNAITPQPVCGPARACLQTGRYASETGNSRNGVALPKGIPTVPRYLKSAGYDLAYVGKWHLAGNATAPPSPELRGGFDSTWYGADLPEYISCGYGGIVYDRDGRTVEFDSYRADAYTDYAINYLRQRPSRQPFFLFLSYVEPHPQPYHRHYQGPEPPTREGIVHDYLRYDCPRGSAETFRNCPLPGDLRALDAKGWMQFPEYLSCCNRVDWNVGRVLAELKAQGIIDETLILYTSDHGCNFHTRGGNDKCTCHDSSVRVPLIVRGPGFAPGAAISTPVSLIDLPPTLLAAAGISPPRHMRGTDLRETSRPDQAFVEIHDRSRQRIERAVRTEHWTYCIGRPLPSPESDPYQPAFLYDLKNDPDQLVNRIDDPFLADVQADLHRQLEDWLISMANG